MSIEDRVRAATSARADLVRDIRPLDFPGDLPARTRRRRVTGRLGGWLIPVATAVAVIVVAAILVAVRDVSGASRASGPAPAGQGGVPAALPRYGVVLTKTTAKVPPQVGSGTVEIANLSVIDTRTGKQVALVKHPADVGFDAVSGAADDRTFAVTASYYGPAPLSGVKGDSDDTRVFYLLRIDPAGAQPYKLTRLDIPAQPSASFVNGFALSPDGRTLAVLEWANEPEPWDKGSPDTLVLYSVATGKAVRTWTGGTAPDPVPQYGDSTGFSQNYAGLTWLADGHTLAFTYYAKGQAPAVRTLDTTRPGTDLVAGSRHVFTLPAEGQDACAEAVLTPDGQTVVCGTQMSSDNEGCGTPTPGHGGQERTTGTLEIDAYSAATGKRERVLFRYTGNCSRDGIGALGWVGPAGTVVAGVVTGSLSSQTYPDDSTQASIGVLVKGRLVPLVPATVPFDQGPGTIAF